MVSEEARLEVSGPAAVLGEPHQEQAASDVSHQKVEVVMDPAAQLPVQAEEATALEVEVDLRLTPAAPLLALLL